MKQRAEYGCRTALVFSADLINAESNDNADHIDFSDIEDFLAAEAEAPVYA